MRKTKFRGFTLVELLAVIVILAIILVIAVPQIMKTIDSARLGAFRSTAKLILTQAEKQHLVDQTLKVDEGSIGTTTYEGTGNGNTECGALAKLGSDYSACKVTVDSEGVATLETLTGTGKFANYSCENATLTGETNVDNSCEKDDGIPKVRCSAGTYLKANESSCTTCPSGSKCTGGKYPTNQSTDQGIVACEEGSTSNEGSSTCITRTGAETLMSLEGQETTREGCTGTGELIKVEHENGVIDYRYTGACPNNYATFNGETWRIIGIFNGRIKLMRDAVIGSAKWDSTKPYSNAWEGSEIELGLNGDYLTSTGYLGKSLSSDAQNLIDNADWYITFMTEEQDTASAYAAERIGNTISRKVGLIYPSDYGYASIGCTDGIYVRTLNNYNQCQESNWMYTSGIYWWTMLSSSVHSSLVLGVRSYGNVDRYFVYDSYGVKPVVYLKSDVKLSGTGEDIDGKRFTFSLD